MSSIAQKLQEQARKRAAEQLAAQNKNLATGMQNTANAVAITPTNPTEEEQNATEGSGPFLEEYVGPVGGYEACAIKSLFADGARFYPVDGYFIPETEAQKNECERWVGMGLICAPRA